MKHAFLDDTSYNFAISIMRCKRILQYEPAISSPYFKTKLKSTHNDMITVHD